jgi:hypothetical protein
MKLSRPICSIYIVIFHVIILKYDNNIGFNLNVEHLNWYLKKLLLT